MKKTESFSKGTRKHALCFFTMLYCLTANIAEAQDAGVEHSIFGIQTGPVGIWAHNETRVSNSIAWRTEVGLDLAIYKNDFYDKTRVAFIPVIVAEPRWYYNLQKRAEKSRNTSENSGNFLSLKTSYHPDWFYIAPLKNIKHESTLSIIPTWGIRRVYWSHLALEGGLGLGYIHVFEEGPSSYDSGLIVNLHLRIGYSF